MPTAASVQPPRKNASERMHFLFALLRRNATALSTVNPTASATPKYIPMSCAVFWEGEAIGAQDLARFRSAASKPDRRYCVPFMDASLLDQQRKFLDRIASGL